MKRMLAVAATLVIVPFIMTHAIAKGDSNEKSSEKSSRKNGVTMNKANQNQQDAIAIIMQDHNHIRKVLGELNKKLGESIVDSKAVYANIKEFLVKHETMEQKVWYPELEKRNDELKDIISHLLKEEDKASKAIDKIDATTDDKEWVEQVRALIKDVDHHAKEEETKLFPKVKETIDSATLKEIGEKLKNYHSDHQMRLKY